MPVVIFSRPDWNDTATQYGKYWTGELEKKCPFPLVDLYKELARRAPNESAIQKDPDAFYYGFGHGNADTFTGQDLETIIFANNIQLWNAAWVHLLSCEVFARLGLKFPNGSGYNKTFYFYINVYPNDVAKQYFDSDQQFALAVWAGKTKAEAQKALKDKFTEYYNAPGQGKDYLPWDRDCHVITGDPNAKWTGVQGIKRITAFYKYEGGGEIAIGDMTSGEDDQWTITWKPLAEGGYSIVYYGEDTEGGIKRVETGVFNVKYPPSGITITPISPKGGESIVARELTLQIEATYQKPMRRR